MLHLLETYSSLRARLARRIVRAWLPWALHDVPRRTAAARDQNPGAAPCEHCATSGARRRGIIACLYEVKDPIDRVIAELEREEELHREY